MKSTEIIELARSELGYIGKKKATDNLDINEAPNGKGYYNKFARDLYEAGYFNGKNKNGYKYCAIFAHWLIYKTAGGFEEAKKVYPYTYLGSSSTWTARAFRDAGKYGTEPREGAFVFFLDGEGDIYHTGFCVEVTGNTVYTIEGNVGYTVVARSYPVGSDKIAGFGYVDYDPEADDRDEQIARLTAELSAANDEIAKKDKQLAEIMAILTR